MMLIPLFRRPSLPTETDAVPIPSGDNLGDLEPSAMRMYIAATVIRTAMMNPLRRRPISVMVSL